MSFLDCKVSSFPLELGMPFLPILFKLLQFLFANDVLLRANFSGAKQRTRFEFKLFS